MERIASLSLDLDNKWSYLKTHGDDGWSSYPSYLDTLVPRVVDFLEQHDVSITFFIVGQDAELEKNARSLKMIADAGHEIGNHSFNHEPWLHLYSKEQLRDELERADKAIQSVTGQRPKGFRGPGFSLSKSTLETLLDLGYEYDCTTFPNFLNPVARAYYLMNSKLDKAEKQKRSQLFGSWGDGLKPLKPHYWQIDERKLLEIPVTTMPIFKVPIHFSYLLYLFSYSPVIAKMYFKMALTLCKLTNKEPSLLLHPLDFMGKDDDKDLAFFPGMQLDSQAKIDFIGDVITHLKKSYRPVTMSEHASIIQTRHVSSREVNFT